MGEKVVVITGAGQGIGQAIARHFGEMGSAVVASARAEDKALATAEDLTDRGLRAVGVRCDVTQRDDIDAMIEAAVGAFGRVDVLINNAGWVGHPTASESRSEEDIERALNTGPKGTIMCSQAAFPHLRETRGAIVNFGSAAALAGSPLMVEHSAAKGAVIAITKTLAMEWADHGIRVNAISPMALTPAVEKHHEEIGKLSSEASDPQGLPGAASAQAEPPRTPLGPVGDAYLNVAPATAFLASDGARWITGQTVCVDGGLYMM